MSEKRIALIREAIVVGHMILACEKHPKKCICPQCKLSLNILANLHLFDEKEFIIPQIDRAKRMQVTSVA